MEHSGKGMPRSLQGKAAEGSWSRSGFMPARLGWGGWTLGLSPSKGGEDCASFVKQDPFPTFSIDGSLCDRHFAQQFINFTSWTSQRPLESGHYCSHVTGGKTKAHRGQMACSRAHIYLVAGAPGHPYRVPDSIAHGLVPCGQRALTPTPGSFLSSGCSAPGPQEAAGQAWASRAGSMNAREAAVPCLHPSWADRAWLP